MKKIFLLVLLFFTFIVGYSFSASWESSPEQIISDLKDENVQNTKLDNTIGGNGQGITETLEDVKKGSTGYVQWLGYIGLSIALILIIYNGILILTNFGEENKLSKAKKRFVSLILGVILLTSAIVIIKLVVGFIGYIF